MDTNENSFIRSNRINDKIERKSKIICFRERVRFSASFSDMDVAGDNGLKSSRKLFKVVNSGEGFSMFHLCQESSAILNENGRRNLACHDQKRRCEMNRSRFYLQRVPRILSRQPLPGTIKLTMEIQNGDFASLLGQREAWSSNDSVAEIMRDTGCMIQFSDQRTAHSAGEVNNQVVITGGFPNIDEAQRRLRYLSPITIAISLRNAKKDLPGMCITNSLTKWCAPDGELASFSNIQFNIVQPPHWLLQHQQKGPFLVIRGSYCDCGRILKATEKLELLLFDGKGREDFCARMEIPLLHRRWVVGSPDGILMRTISMRSCCTIHFPVTGRGQAATSYFLNGEARAVISAIKMFYDISPVRMEFDIENCHLAYPISFQNGKKREHDQFDTENNVIITLRKSQYEGEFRLDGEDFRHTVFLMTSEENLNNMYAVRRKLLSELVWAEEKTPPKRRTHRPQFIDHLRILITEASEKKAHYMNKSAHQHHSSRHDWM